jgi:hypothetical protein
MSGSVFYDLNAVSKIAVNLFYGWGYNFYRLENQLRADDQLIRAKVGWLLGEARASVERAESAYRREFLPPPSREKPRPDAAAVAGAQAIERLSKDIGAVAGQIRALPVPENDRMTQRYRQEAATLTRLGECDQVLVGQAELLRTTVAHKDGGWLIENRALLEDGLRAITATLHDRQGVLLG